MFTWKGFGGAALGVLVSIGCATAEEMPRFGGKAANASDIVRSAARSGEVRVIVEFAPARKAAGDLTPAQVQSETSRILTSVFGAASARSGQSWQASPMQYAPMFSFVGTTADVEALARNGQVVTIYPDRQSSPHLDQSVPLVGATASVFSGNLGANQIVAVIDTGVMKTHAFLSGSVISEACYSNANVPGANSLCPGQVGSATGAGTGLNCSLAWSGDCSHGTHVAGIISGKAATGAAAGTPKRGVAPSSRIIAIQAGSKNGTRVTFWDSDLIRALERVYQVRGYWKGKKVVAVNMSLGGGMSAKACDSTSALTAVVNKLRSVNIATVISSGNDSNPLGVGFPGCISTAITVGSTDDADKISSFSNRGPLIDVFAPGSAITSAVANSTTSFSSFNGTSMAAPHVAGAFALMRRALPSATVEDIEAALEGKTKLITDPVTKVRKPRIALNLARPAVTQALLNELDDTPFAFIGRRGGTSFTSATGLTRRIKPSNGTVSFATSESLSWLGIAAGSASGTITAPNARTLSFTFNTTAAKALSTGIYTGRALVSNKTVTQAPREIEATLVAYMPASINNHRGNATTVLRTILPGMNTGATLQTGEPTSQFMNGSTTFYKNTVWWKKKWTSSGVKTVNTLGSEFDTVLCVYSAPLFSALVGCNDFFLPGDFNPSQVVFNATAGTTYYFQIGSWIPTATSTPATGLYVLNTSP